MAKDKKIKNTFGKVEETREVEFVEGCFLTLARANNRSFRDKMKRFRKNLKKSLNRHRNKQDTEFDNLTAEQEDKMLSDAYAGTVLLGWRGMVVDGEQIKYTDDTAAGLMFAHEEFREFVAEEAADFDEFIKEEKEELVKKSLSPINGD